MADCPVLPAWTLYPSRFQLALLTPSIIHLAISLLALGNGYGGLNRLAYRSFNRAPMRCRELV
jgi:hypothetical protein